MQQGYQLAVLREGILEGFSPVAQGAGCIPYDALDAGAKNGHPWAYAARLRAANAGSAGYSKNPGGSVLLF